MLLRFLYNPYAYITKLLLALIRYKLLYNLPALCLLIFSLLVYKHSSNTLKEVCEVSRGIKELALNLLI